MAGSTSPARVSKDPYLQIHEDGTIRARNPFTKDKPQHGKLSKKELIAEERARRSGNGAGTAPPDD